MSSAFILFLFVSIYHHAAAAAAAAAAFAAAAAAAGAAFSQIFVICIQKYIDFYRTKILLTKIRFQFNF